MAGALFLAAVSATASVSVYFPGSFVGSWGIEGTRCGTEGTSRVEIKPRGLNYDGHHQSVVRVMLVKSNVIEIALRRDRAHQLYRERLTVGTTGSRLFREQDNKFIAVYYRCE
jgi:hypothetical protein